MYQHVLLDTEMNNGYRLGIDTHADNSCARKHVRILKRIDDPKFDIYLIRLWNLDYEYTTDIVLMIFQD